MPDPDVETLRAAVAGTVLTATDDGWDAARTAWNLAVDLVPALIALPSDPSDVVAIVDFARRNALRVAPLCSGHNAGSLGSLGDAVLVSMVNMNRVTVDVDVRTARVEAGALWGAVTAATDAPGLFPLSGSSADVGVVGYTLGGGLSFLARKHGLAANHVVAVELVTPDGVLLETSADKHADVFWAVRGGAANFGVVTAIAFALFPYGHVIAGMFLWPYERHREVLDAWHRWTRRASEDVTTAFRILHFPPLPQLPPFLSGRSVVVIDGVVIGDAAAAGTALAELRALAPEMDTWAPCSPAGLDGLHMDPPVPTPGISATRLLGDLDAAGLEAFAAAIPPGSPLMFGELRHLGGALAEAPEGAGAAGFLVGDYLLSAVGNPAATEPADIESALAAVTAALAGCETGKVFANFAERPTAPDLIYNDEVYARLSAIRAAVDPDGVMLAGHPLIADPG